MAVSVYTFTLIIEIFFQVVCFFVLRIFWQRVHGSSVTNGASTRSYTDNIPARYSASYLNKILKYFKYLQNIWNIVGERFSDKLIKLFKNDGNV